MANSYLIVIATLLSMSLSKLQIFSPQTLASKFEGTHISSKHSGGEIKASYANFGHIPYGQSIVRFEYLESFLDRLFILRR